AAVPWQPSLQHQQPASWAPLFGRSARRSRYLALLRSRELSPVPTPCPVRLPYPADNPKASLAVHSSPPVPTAAPLKVIEPSSLLIVRRATHKCAITRSFARHRLWRARLPGRHGVGYDAMATFMASLH